MSTKLLKGLLLFYLLGLGNADAALKTSTGSGIWSNNGTWSPSGVPACGDSIVILSGHTVSITNQQNHSSCGSRMSLSIIGILYFVGGDKLRLPCNSSVYIYAGGTLASDGSGSSNQLEICGTTYWTGTMGNVNGPVCFPPNTCGIVLPFRLKVFRGFPCGEQACFEWTTPGGLDTERFELWKTVNGEPLALVSSIPSTARDTDGGPDLHFTSSDEHPTQGTAYYRLSVVGAGGLVEHSKFVRLDMGGSGLVNFRHFVDDQGRLYLVVTGLEAGTGVKATVYSMLGGIEGSLDLRSTGSPDTHYLTTVTPNSCSILTVEADGSPFPFRGKVVR